MEHMAYSDTVLADMAKELTPTNGQIQAIRDGGVSREKARLIAWRDNMVEAIESAQTVDDLKPILYLLMKGVAI